MSEIFDVVLKGGRVIDPAAGIDGVRDVAIKGGRIAAVAENMLPTSAKETIDCRGKLVLPGLIDTHGHVFQYVTGRFGLEADMCGVHSGVTTLIDQGGPSCMTCRRSASTSSSQVAVARARLHVGLHRRRPGRPLLPDALQPDCLDVDATVRSAHREPGHGQGLQGARRDRRLRALGHRGDEARRRDRPPGASCRCTSTSASCGPARKTACRRGPRHHLHRVPATC